MMGQELKSFRFGGGRLTKLNILAASAAGFTSVYLMESLILAQDERLRRA